MEKLLIAEMEAAIKLLEAGYSKDVKKLFALIRQHTLLVDKQHTPDKETVSV